MKHGYLVHVEIHKSPKVTNYLNKQQVLSNYGKTIHHKYRWTTGFLWATILSVYLFNFSYIGNHRYNIVNQSIMS